MGREDDSGADDGEPLFSDGNESDGGGGVQNLLACNIPIYSRLLLFRISKWFIMFRSSSRSSLN